MAGCSEGFVFLGSIDIQIQRGPKTEMGGGGGNRPAVGLLICLMVAAMLCLGWADSWESIRQDAGKIRTIRAAFIQEKHLTILNRPLVSKGIFCFKAPDNLRWEYRSPIESILLMHGGKIRRYIRTDRGIIQDAGARLQAMQLVMREITGWLAGRFTDNPDFEAALIPGPKIVLTPRSPALAGIIQKIELVPAQQPGVIRTVTIYENAHSYTRLTFTDCRLNKKMDDRLFEELK
jgi:outer membrane lipoprotein carrier protein